MGGVMVMSYKAQAFPLHIPCNSEHQSVSSWGHLIMSVPI